MITATLAAAALCFGFLFFAACGVILRMYYHGELTLDDLNRLASPQVYREVLRLIDAISLGRIEVTQ